MADTRVLTAADAAPDAAYGGKAAALRRLQGEGLPVPAWFALSPAACPRSRRVGASLRAEMEEAVRALDAARVAVRSSAVDEDGAAHSFAGQLDSVLGVAPGDVPAAVERVWDSAFGERVRAYRTRHGLGEPTPPAVLVQAMVEPIASGVAFGVDPVGGRWGHAVVSAVYGLGTALVGGEADADTWTVDRAGGIVERRVADKRTADRPGDGPGGVRAEPVGERQRGAPAIPDEVVRAVAELARRCGDLSGRPQDIEWAWDGRRLWLLQSRPITTLGAVADPDGIRAIWDNSNIVESYPGLTLPLTFSYARAAYQLLFDQLTRELGVSTTVRSRLEPHLAHLLGLIRGRIYYNLASYYRLFAAIPGFGGFVEKWEVALGIEQKLGFSGGDRKGSL